MNFLHVHHYLIYGMFFVMCFYITAKEHMPCPMGFDLSYDERHNEYICYKLKQAENFKDKYKDCEENLYNLGLHFRLNTTKFEAVSFWIDYHSLYPGELYMNFVNPKLEILLMHTINNRTLQNNKEACLVVNNTNVLTTVHCDELHNRYCFVKSEINNGSNLGKNLEAVNKNTKNICTLTVTNAITWFEAKSLCEDKEVIQIKSELAYSGMPGNKIEGEILRYTGKRNIETDDLIYQLLHDLKQLLDNEAVPILMDDLNSVFDQVNYLMDIDINLAFPSEIPRLLQELGPKVDLSAVHDGSVIRDNIGLELTLALDRPDFFIWAFVVHRHDSFSTNSFQYIGSLPNIQILGFKKTNYVGVIEIGMVSLEPITLTYGYSPGVMYSLRGDLESYFLLVLQGSTVTLQLLLGIPEELIPTNGIIILELRATLSGSIPADTAIVLKVLEDLSLEVQLTFSETYYVGSYTAEEGLISENTISLATGYDDYVMFELEGDDSLYFEIQQSGNYIILILSTPIPNDVIANNNQLVFIIHAWRANTSSTRAAIIIHLPNELPDDAQFLGFERTNYLGMVIQDFGLVLEPIVLTEGYTSDVVFNLKGELESYFSLLTQDEIVYLQLDIMVFPDETILSNQIIVLELEATTENSIPAVATIVLEVITNSPHPTRLKFAETYYVATYSENEDIAMEKPISLSEGYDEQVTFELIGDYADYFDIVQVENSVTLIAPMEIPPAILANNHHLLIIINAQRPNMVTAEATIIIKFLDEFPVAAILGFEKTRYIGVLENEILDLRVERIVVTEGYSPEVIFSIYGDLAQFFALSLDYAAVTLELLDQIPEEVISANRIMVLEIRASAPGSSFAAATIVLEVLDYPLHLLAFTETYYTGTYTVSEGLTLEPPISLSQGYDEYVTFELEEDDSVHFGVVRSGNSVMLITPRPISNAVVGNNNKLLFVINAQRSNATAARAAVIVHLPNEFSEDAILKFEKTSYLGVIENETVNLEQIILIEGYTSDVFFTVYGDMAGFFDLISQDANITLLLLYAIPEELISTRRIIILDLYATTVDSMPATTTIVLEVVLNDMVLSTQLVFTETYYVGTYTVDYGITLENTISLTAGYDENVQFELEEDDSMYFEVVQNGNSVTLKTPAPIPNAVVANNNHLLFSINAQRPSMTIARAAILIHLPNEFTDDATLGFEKTSYIGVIENGILHFEQIILREGPTPNVVYSLHGDLASFFALISLSSMDGTVTLVLLSAIPEELIPSNSIIILEIRGVVVGAIPAVATIVLEVVLDDFSLSDRLVFAEPYYVGTYSVYGSTTLENPVSLSEGYDDDVMFKLEGDDSIHFEVVQSGNLVTLRSPVLLPNAIVHNNHQLLFIVTAQRSNSTTARATIVIHLSDGFVGEVTFSFDKTSYLGVIANGILNLDPIMTEGLMPAILVSVHGDLEGFFRVTLSESAVITLHLDEPIPEELIPINRIVILEISGTTTGVMPAIAAIVLEVLLDDLSLVIKLAFEEAYYVGTYSAETGVVLGTPIMLSAGFDETVMFELEEDDSMYFELVQTGNSVTLRTPEPIPTAIVVNNNQLLFVINAQRPNSMTARAVVVILLPNAYSSPPNFNPSVTDAIVTMPNELFGKFWQYNFLVFRDATIFDDPREVYTINSRIINVNLNTLSDLENMNINIYLRPLVTEENNMRRACVHWQFSDDGSGYWSEEGCRFTSYDDSELLDTCACNLRFTYYAEALIPLTVEQLIEQLIKDIHQLMSESEFYTFSEVDHILDQLNNLLELDEYVVFPEDVLRLLLQFIQRLLLFPQVTRLGVRNRVALLSVNTIVGHRGISAARTDDNNFTEQTFNFITDEIDISMLNANHNDLVLSVATLEVVSEIPIISYMVFHDGRLVNDSNGSYTVISRVLSTNIDVHATEINTEDYEIKLYLRPLIAESETSSRRTCVRWLSEDGIGYWTEEGCKLIISDDPELLDTCQCTWFMTYYAMALFSETVTTTETSTTTLRPEEQIQQVLEDLYELLNQTTPILVENVTEIFDQVDDLLNLETELDFPGMLLQLLEELGTRVDLSGLPTSAVVGDNIGLLMADAKEDNPVRGLVLASRDTDAFTPNAFDFLLGELNSSLLHVDESEAVVFLPLSVTSNPRRISFVVYRDSRAFSYDRDVYATNSRVISISVGNNIQLEYGEVVDIHLRSATGEPNRDERRKCAYWQFLEDGTGYWSQEGCTLIKSGDPSTLDTCRCDHLTHFAEVLFPRSVFSQLNEDILEILSIIGCILSIFGLVVIMLTAVLFKSWRRNYRNQIWLQLCIALFLTAVCFLTVVFSTYDTYSISCMIIGICLHYSIVASFCWMLVVAIKSYNDIVLVFQKQVPYKRLIASGFSWGVPALIVIILLSVNSQSYSGHFDDINPSSNFCYPSGTGLWVAVYMPILVVLVANWTIFILIVRKIGFAPKGPRSHKAGDTHEAWACIRLSVVLVFLFGLPWLFGIFSYNVVAAYFFTCTVTTQGFVLFLLIICRNKQTRNLWFSKLKRAPQKLYTVTSSYS